MQQNRSQAGEIVRVRYLCWWGLAFVQSWPTEPKNRSGWSAPACERWPGARAGESECKRRDNHRGHRHGKRAKQSTPRSAIRMGTFPIRVFARLTTE